MYHPLQDDGTSVMNSSTASTGSVKVIEDYYSDGGGKTQIKVNPEKLSISHDSIFVQEFDNSDGKFNDNGSESSVITQHSPEDEESQIDTLVTNLTERFFDSSLRILVDSLCEDPITWWEDLTPINLNRAYSKTDSFALATCLLHPPAYNQLLRKVPARHPHLKMIQQMLEEIVGLKTKTDTDWKGELTRIGLYNSPNKFDDSLKIFWWRVGGVAITAAVIGIFAKIWKSK